MSRLNPRWLEKYWITFAMGFETALEYRVNFAISLISAAYPIFIQTFLWTAIYGGTDESELFGYTYHQIIAYTFLAGLVARIVRTGFEYEIMDDVKNGRFSKFLVQPVGYFPYRLANFFGQKIPSTGMILVILAVTLVGLGAFGAITLHLGRIALFLAIMVLAMTLNFLIFYCISAIAFWIVEIGFLFEGFRIVIVLLSGGIFPLEVFGRHFVAITNFLPFKYTVNYPINVLSGKIAGDEIALGVVVQCLWIAACIVLADRMWRAGSKRYIAVGG